MYYYHTYIDLALIENQSASNWPLSKSIKVQEIRDFHRQVFRQLQQSVRTSRLHPIQFSLFHRIRILMNAVLWRTSALAIIYNRKSNEYHQPPRLLCCSAISGRTNRRALQSRLRVRLPVAEESWVRLRSRNHLHSEFLIQCRNELFAKLRSVFVVESKVNAIVSRDYRIPVFTGLSFSISATYKRQS